LRVIAALGPLLRRFGKDIVPLQPTEIVPAQLPALLAARRVDLVLDVGANVGQYARALRGADYRGRIVSFEPVAGAHARLVAAAAADPAWTAAPRMALGAADGEAEINVSNRTDMSSLLPIRGDTLAALPKAQSIGREPVPVRRLDGVYADYAGAGARAFLKIDTQGFERAVLDGAGAILAELRGLQLELSLLPLYEGEAGYLEMIDRLAAAGFEIHLLIPGFFSKRLGRQLQIDAVFLRPAPS